MSVAALMAGPTKASVQTATSPTAGQQPQQLALSFEDAAELARLGNSRVERAERSAKIAELQVKSAKAAYFPRVDVAVSANQSARGSVFHSQDVAFRQGLIGDFRGGISVSANAPIDIAGIIGRRVQSTRISETIAELELDRARTDTVADTQIAYLTALKAQRAAQLDSQVIASIRQLIGKAAKDSQPIIAFLGLELASARQMANARTAELELTQDGLKRSLGLDPQVPLVLTSNLPEADRLKDIATLAGDLSQRHDLEVARRRVELADLSVKQADDQRRPSIRAGVYLDQYFGGKFVSDTGETSSRSVGLNLSLNFPLLNFDAGQSGNSKKIAQLQAEQARSDWKDLRRQAEYELKQANASWERAVERVSALPNPEHAAQALASAERNLLSAPADMAPTLLAQVTNARSAWRSAEGAAGDAAVDLAIAAIRWRKVEGRVLAPAELLDQSKAASTS
ncbi:MAG TPA: TolC family protein [Sphingomicrobium sp.]|nr:TolC family protein [Sphingomicrobium sp.]